jgi:hypothetical protein
MGYLTIIDFCHQYGIMEIKEEEIIVYGVSIAPFEVILIAGNL